MNRLRYIVITAAALLLATAALALAGQHRPATHTRAAVVEQTTPDTDNVQQGDQTTPDVSSTASVRTHPKARHVFATVRRAKTHSKNSASKSATTANTADETNGEGEQTAESEQGQPGEPAVGHQDPAGNVNHECTGDCVE